MIYRMFLVIAVGAGLCVAPCKAETTSQAQRQQLEVQRAIAADVGRIAKSSVEQDARARQPDPLNAPCTVDAETRASDLCAQWKAADAARDAANYAWWTLLISGVGTGLLIWTLWETRANARRELRAYVSVKIAGMEARAYRGDGLRLVLHTVAHNGGATPAYNCSHFGFIVPMSKNDALSQLRAIRDVDQSAEIGGSVIHSGEDFTARMENMPAIDGNVVHKLKSGDINLYAFGVTTYKDTFGRKRRTDFCYTLDTAAFNISLGESEQRSGEKIPIEWVITPFHNSAT